MKINRFSVIIVIVTCLFSGAVVQAATWELFDEATLSNTGPSGDTVVRLSSLYLNSYGYVRYIPDSPFLLNSLITLSADFNMVQGPFAGGSPRFDIGLDFNKDGAFDWSNDRLIMANWGTQPWGSGPPPTGWTNTGNFMGTALWSDIIFFDGNTQYTLAGLKSTFGDLNVMRVYVSLDSGWAGNAQVLDIDHFTVNNDVYSPAATPEPATMLLLGLGLVGLAGFRRRMK